MRVRWAGSEKMAQEDGQVSTKVNCETREKLGQGAKRSAAVPGQDGRGSYPESICGPPGEMLGLLSPLVSAVSCCMNPFCSRGVVLSRRHKNDLMISWRNRLLSQALSPGMRGFVKGESFLFFVWEDTRRKLDAETSLSERSGERSLNN